MPVRPICPAAQQCANRDARAKLLEQEVDRLRGLDAIREDVAKLLQEEIDELTRRLRAATDQAVREQAAPDNDRFRRVKVAVSKALHPNNFAHDKIAATIRGEIFKELWPEIERIERRES
jgi:hypothetical protein